MLYSQEGFSWLKFCYHDTILIFKLRQIGVDKLKLWLIMKKFASKIQQIRHLASLRNRPPPTTTTPAPTTSTYSPHDCGRDKNGILWCAGNRIYEKPKPKPKKKPIDNGGRVVLSKYSAKIGKPKQEFYLNISSKNINHHELSLVPICWVIWVYSSQLRN